MRFKREKLKNPEMVPEMGLEPIWIAPFDFKSNAYTNSATRALFNYIIRLGVKKAPGSWCRGNVSGRLTNRGCYLEPGGCRRRTGMDPACGGDCLYLRLTIRRALRCLE